VITNNLGGFKSRSYKISQSAIARNYTMGSLILPDQTRRLTDRYKN